MALARTNQSNTVALPSDVIVAHICILKGVENVLYLNESNSCRLWYCRFIRIGDLSSLLTRDCRAEGQPGTPCPII